MSEVKPSRPFQVFPAYSTGDDAKPLRFDPNQWTLAGTKSYGEQWDIFDGFYHYNCEESLYYKGKSWVLITFRAHFDLGDTERPTFKRLSLEEAADWFVECEDDPPAELEAYLLAKSLLPEDSRSEVRLDASTMTKVALPAQTPKSAQQGLNVAAFVEFWHEAAEYWNQIEAIGTKAQSSFDVEIADLKRISLNLVEETKEYARYRFDDPSTILGELAGIFFYLPTPFDAANLTYCEMLTAMQELTHKLSVCKQSIVTLDLAEICCEIGKCQSAECQKMIQTLYASTDSQIRDYLFERAIERLSKDEAKEQSCVQAVPVWDGRKLVVDRKIITQFTKPAKNQTAILDAFQNENWPPRIYDPLPFPADSQRLRETVADLNQRQGFLTFRCDGTGAGVTWEERGK